MSPACLPRFVSGRTESGARAVHQIKRRMPLIRQFGVVRSMSFSSGTDCGFELELNVGVRQKAPLLESATPSANETPCRSSSSSGDGPLPDYFWTPLAPWSGTAHRGADLAAPIGTV